MDAALSFAVKVLLKQARQFLGNRDQGWKLIQRQYRSGSCLLPPAR
jgi:hypothetical protein